MTRYDHDRQAPVAGPRLGISWIRGEFAVKFQYDQTLLDLFKAAVPGRRWDRDQKLWFVPTSSAVQLADFARRQGALVGDVARAKLDGIVSLMHDSAGIDADFTVEGLRGTLMPYQRAGVAYLARARRSFLADEMGLGKTIQAIATVHHLGAYPAIVVCPASLKINWQREIRKWTGGRTAILAGRGNLGAVRGLAGNAEWIVLNYDILAAGAEEVEGPDGKTVTEYEMVSALRSLGPRALILDESHYAKNPKAQRTMAVKDLASGIPPDGIVLCVSGTPLLNRPKELVSQLEILGHIGDGPGREFGRAWSFLKRYCDAHRDKYGWDVSGASNLEELNQRLRSRCYVRRRKEDVLTELPPKLRADTWVEPETADMREYRKAEQELISYLAARAAELARAAGTDPTAAAMAAAIRAEAAEHLVRINTLRKLIAKAKLEPIKEWVETFLASSNRKLVVFAHHREILESLVSEFKALKIIGGDDLGERQKAVDLFQDPAGPRLIVCSIKAAGVGLTLTAASDVAFAELDWHMASLQQCEDRLHRIGQSWPVCAYYLMAPATIDSDMWGLLAEKARVVDAATEGHGLEGSVGILGDLLASLAGRGGA